MSLTACAILPSKQVAFADNQNGRLIFHDKDGSFSGDIELYDLFDLTPIDSSYIAVVAGEDIKIVDINTKKIDRTITGYGNDGWGICYGNGKLYGVDNGHIKIIYLDGTGLQYIPVKLDMVYNVAVHNDQIYCISTETKTLYAIDHFGNHLWTFHDYRLHRPQCFLHNNSISLDVDNHGNVFIVLPDYDQVIVVSCDGQQYRVILDKSNNLKGPSGISYCRETDQMLVCSVSDERATIYDIKI